MKIEHKKTREDGGGSMIVTAITPEEKLALLKHFHIAEDDPCTMADILRDPQPLIVEKEAGGRDNYAWFECTGCLDLEFTTPYFKEYVRRTGDTGRGILPDLSPEFLTPFFPWMGLKHTHYISTVWTEGGHLCYRCIVHVGDWNGRTAADRADSHALDYMQEDIGTRPQEREFRENRNGTYSPNPNYLKRHGVKPSCTAEWFFTALIEWWLANCANTAQKRLAEADRALMFANHRGAGNLRDVKSCGTRELRTSWDSPAVSWEEFQKLGELQPA